VIHRLEDHFRNYCSPGCGARMASCAPVADRRLSTVRAYAETGADFVSSGAITHSARAVDLSFRLELL
jgi:Quinolinate phosphoribosyl transferase, C-terminal domain